MSMSWHNLARIGGFLFAFLGLVACSDPASERSCLEDCADAGAANGGRNGFTDPDVDAASEIEGRDYAVVPETSRVAGMLADGDTLYWMRGPTFQADSGLSNLDGELWAFTPLDGKQRQIARRLDVLTLRAVHDGYLYFSNDGLGRVALDGKSAPEAFMRGAFAGLARGYVWTSDVQALHRRKLDASAESEQVLTWGALSDVTGGALGEQGGLFNAQGGYAFYSPSTQAAPELIAAVAQLSDADLASPVQIEGRYAYVATPRGVMRNDLQQLGAWQVFEGMPGDNGAPSPVESWIVRGDYLYWYGLSPKGTAWVARTKVDGSVTAENLRLPSPKDVTIPAVTATDHHVFVCAYTGDRIHYRALPR